MKGYRECLTLHNPNTPVSDRAPFVLWRGDCGLHPHFVANLYMGKRTLWWESWKKNKDQTHVKGYAMVCFLTTTHFSLQTSGHIKTKNTITHAYRAARCGCSGPSMFLLSAASHTAHLSHEVHLCPAWSLSRHLRHTLPRTFYSTSPSSPPAEKLLTHQTLNLCPICLMWLKAVALTWMFSLTYTA